MGTRTDYIDRELKDFCIEIFEHIHFVERIDGIEVNRIRVSNTLYMELVGPSIEFQSLVPMTGTPMLYGKEVKIDPSLTDFQFEVDTIECHASQNTA